ncbi:MAG: peptide-methionine (S)-S-oxide reductase [Bacteroidota bacterium]
MGELDKIGLGGGCHWCTEAVFQSLRGVHRVDQGWIASEGLAHSFSEAVIVHFDPNAIPLEVLVAIHLHTHESTSNHSMRGKYRSALYVFSEKQRQGICSILKVQQKEFNKPLITQILPYRAFKASEETFQEYYFKDPEKPFCARFIDPKLQLLLNRFSQHTNTTKLKHLKSHEHH